VDAVLRAAAVYLVLLLLLRLSGKRTLAQITVFDFILLLIISEATQQALLGNDFSITQAALVILTLIALDRAFDYFSFRSSRADRLVNGSPLVLIEQGRPLHDRMDLMRLTPDDVLDQARQSQGLERLDQIEYAVLERNGRISVVPKRGAG
jgi:uncharacterized membrane protein YcaP (DUF421 family)